MKILTITILSNFCIQDISYSYFFVLASLLQL